MTITVPNLDQFNAAVEIGPWRETLIMRLTFGVFGERIHVESDIDGALQMAIAWIRSRVTVAPKAKQRQQGAIEEVQRFIAARSWIAGAESIRRDDRPAVTASTPEEPMAKKKMSIPVEFGNVNFGAEVVRVGVKVSRDALAIDVADQTLCGRRLKGRIIRLRDGESENQKPLAGMEGERHEISGVFDVKSFNVKPKTISSGLTFPLEGIEVEELVHFSKQSGRLIVEDIEDLPEPEAKKGDDEDGDSGEDE